ncbi:LOW QUALITY PROTEIN: serine/threonine-protein kinase ATR [Lepeophtheirus salmonis]|uniref:LOW QUALITY PROTEIN: serine/threonine-protein kinase ATR n=1 Tax=Lepeophtheirus salmonis TaxID=72036 RepID=UPI001AEA6002|nr:LOW QUALITY PROTEIN: serine/threonine-protein kinase ATR-like [Lepeophtheirus salmonis]
MSTYFYEEQRILYNISLYKTLVNVFRTMISKESSNLFINFVFLFWEETVLKNWESFIYMDEEFKRLLWDLLKKAENNYASIIDFFLEREFVSVDCAFVYEHQIKMEMKKSSNKPQSCRTWQSILLIFEKLSKMDDHELLLSTLRGIAKICRYLEVSMDEISSCLFFFEEETLIEIGQILFECAVNDPSSLSTSADIFMDLLPNFNLKEVTCESFYHLALATISLPWKLSQEMKVSDLKVGAKLRKRIQGDKSIFNRQEESKVKLIRLITLLPPWLTPRWRLGLLQKIWSDSDYIFCECLISNLHFIIFNIPEESKIFAEEITSQTIKLGVESLLCALVNVAPLLICTFSNTNELIFEKNKSDFDLKCLICSKDKPLTCVSPSISHLIKLIGYSHSSPAQIAKMVNPLSLHVGLTQETARIWMNFFENENCIHLYPKYIKCFSKFMGPLKEQLSRLKSNNPDGIVVDLFIALSTLEEMDSEYLIHELTSLYLNGESHVSTFIAAQEFLRSNVIKYKYIILKVGAEMLDSRTLNLLTVLFRSSKSSVFLNQNMHHILPHVVLSKSKKKLEFISTQSETSLRHLLVEKFQHVFPCIVFHSKGPKEYNTCIKFIETMTKVSLEELLSSKRQRVTTELLLHMSTYQKKIISALSWLAENDTQCEIPDKKDIRKYIEPKILGVLGFIDNKISNPNISKERKNKILESLNELMAYMGPDFIGSVKHKILTILQSVDSYCDSLVQCWKTFVTKALDSLALGTIICEVLANLVPLLSQNREEVIKIFEDIIIKRGKREFREHFHKLYFLPDKDELADINKVISKENQLPNLPCKDLLRVTAESLECKNYQVQYQVLSKLKTILRLNVNPVQGLIVSSNTTDPFITSLIFRLVRGLRDVNNDSLRSLYGEVLGELGAIDPGRLHTLEYGDLDKNENDLDVSLSSNLDKLFAQNLLNNLVHGYLSSEDSGDSDSCAYSIQEILKKFNVQPGKNCCLWNSFSDEYKEVLTPFLTSLYSRTEKCSFSSYNYSKCLSFSEWIANWSCYLIDKIPRDHAREIFAVCKPALKKDIIVAKFLLPFIIIEILVQCSMKGIEMDRIYLETMEVVESNSDFKRDALAVIFSVLDLCNSFLRKRYELMAGKVKKLDAPDKLKAKDLEYSAVSCFVKRIPSKLMAQSSFECQAYIRSLMHFEHYLSYERNGSLERPEDLFMLQKLYGALDESDFVVGVSKSRKTDPSLEEMIHMYEATGNYQDALAVYESLSRIRPGMIRCYLEMDQPNTAYVLSKSIESDDDDDNILNLRLEAAWRLSKWEDIESATIEKPSWEKDLARLINCIRKKDETNFYSLMVESRKRIMEPLAACAVGDDLKGSYAHSYRYIARLQMLHEAESIASNYIFPHKSNQDRNKNGDLLLLLRTRLDFGQYSLVHQESILQLRKTLFSVALNSMKESSKSLSLKKELIWTSKMSAKVARKAGQFQKAFNLLTEASKAFGRCNIEILVEESKLCWARGNANRAIEILKKVVDSTTVDKDNQDKILLISEAKLLLARYLDDGASLDAESVTAFYKDARESLPGYESACYYSAKFFYKIIGKNYQDSDLDSKGDFVYHVIILYGKALVFGCNSLHEALPRILSLWLDFGARMCSVKPNDGKLSYESMTTNLDRINKVISKMIDKWPPYYLLTAFPQLTSRICHPHPVCWSNLKKILIKTFINCPQHAFWHMVALSRSSYELRRQRCAEVLNGFGRNERFPEDSKKFTDGLLELCIKQLDLRATSLKKEMPHFFRLLTSKDFSQIMMPIARNMAMMLPTCSETSKSQHNPFPSGLVYFEKPDDSLTVMKSLVRPKKISFWGSNGKKYSFLCKPKDDLRRDCRLIDFNNLLNILLNKDPESRRRDLHIRTYTVFPLDELNGIIEWMDNLVLFRHVLLALYEERIGSKAILKMEDYKLYETSRTDFDKNMRSFQALKKRFSPPVFGEWFIRNFPDPQTWYASRLAYVRTTAVMSMVCYLFGLGDRHGENIMFHSKNGDTVHVDLNCLFNKGDTLAIPEVVPFRLTQNMVHAMGPLGVEGPFRIACENSLNLMRKEKDVLTSTLRPFLFDPLLDWMPRHSKSAKTPSTAKVEAVNEKAVDALKNIERRLNGYVVCRKKNNRKTPSSMPLSVSGQVDFLINEAMSEDNLSQMYLGWAPYL